MKRLTGHFSYKIFFIILLIVLFSLSNTSFPQFWKQTFSAPVGTVQSVFFTSPTTGFIAGDSTSIRKSTDGGKTWELKYRGISFTSSLQRIFFVNEMIGFSVGDYGTFVKTLDGGETWEKISVSNYTSSMNAVYFLDENEGFIAAKASSGWAIIRTTDGGTTWNQVLTSPSEIYDINFGGGRNGIVAGKSVAELYYSSDGINWNKSATPSLGGVSYWRSDMYGAYVVSSELAYLVGNGSVTLGMQPTILLKSTDGGANWTYQEQAEANKAYEIMKSVVFKDPLNGLAVGGSSYKSAFLKTTDGGVNWIPYDVPSGGTMQSIYSFGDHVWAGGNGGVIIYSSDFGNTWELKTEIPSGTLYSIQSFGDVVYAGGSYGQFLKSTNGGIDWKVKYAVSNSMSPQIEKVFFLNESTGYIARWYGQVCKTLDGGETWNQILNNTYDVSVKNFDIYFFNELLGFVVGQPNSSGDIIHKTTDGGISWSSTSGLVNSALRSVSFADENHGVIVADKLRGLYTTDGGNTWITSAFHSVPETNANANLLGVTFTSDLSAIAVGDGVIFKSNDGGANWEFVGVPGLQQLKGVSFFDANEGYIVGHTPSFPYYVAVYKTEDAGNNWTNIGPDSNVVRPMMARSIIVDDNKSLWITGPSTYTTANLVGIEEFERTSPANFKLYQNYPNPFNPATKIKFNLTEGSLVNISVYDMLGREIQILLNEYKNAGTHEMTFNGSALTSGVYFYVIRSGANTVSKKMSLVK